MPIRFAHAAFTIECDDLKQAAAFFDFLHAHLATGAQGSEIRPDPLEATVGTGTIGAANRAALLRLPPHVLQVIRDNNWVAFSAYWEQLNQEVSELVTERELHARTKDERERAERMVAEDVARAARAKKALETVRGVLTAIVEIARRGDISPAEVFHIRTEAVRALDVIREPQ